MLSRTVFALLILIAGGAVAFPTDPLDVTVEAYYDSTWNDITTDVFDRDGNNSITITRGRGPEGSRAEAGRALLKLNNANGKYSPRNPNSVLYGKIGRNTPLRISYTYGAVTYIRFVGEVTAWPSKWDPSGSDVWVQLEAWGILRRLEQGNSPLHSAMHRTMSGVSDDDFIPLAYWPLEGGSGSGVRLMGAWTVGTSPAKVTGDVSLSGYGEAPGSVSVPTLGAGGMISGQFPPTTLVADGSGNTVAQIQFMAMFPSTLSADNSLLEVDVPPLGTDNIRLLRLVWQTSSELQLRWHNTSVPTGFASIDFAANPGLFDRPLLVAITMSSDVSGAPGLVNIFLTIFDGGPAAAAFDSGSWTGTVPAPSTWRAMATTGNEGWSFSHLALFTDPAAVNNPSARDNARGIDGHAGEQAQERIVRLCREEQISVSIVGDGSQLIGAQRVATLPDLLEDAAAVDRGFLYEQRDAVALAYRTNTDRYGQAAALVLDYSAQQIHPPFEPLPDDQGIFNDVTVSSRDGIPARVQEDEGPLSVQDPPNGVGRYNTALTVDSYSDDQLPHIASWVKTLGTQDVERYPVVRVNLAANPSLIPAAAATDTQDRLILTDLPSWMPPGDADLVIDGYIETISQFSLDIVYNTTPGNVYQQIGRWGLLAHKLHAAINSSTTSIDIATTSLTQPLLETAAAKIGSGYGITVGGEEMQVTAVADSLVTFGVAGTAAHANNANVTPGIPASVATGNLLLAFAAIRNSGSGVPNTPSGYTRLPIFPSTANCQVFAKIATSGAEAAPTISFTGGAVDADTSAQMIRLGGKWHDVNNILVGSAQRLNPSASNIQYPGLPKPSCDNCIILHFSWKSDDWTSVDNISGFTEIGEPDTTTGFDQGILWGYAIQTTATSVPSFTAVVNGTISQISRSAVAALRCDYQTATVTRSTNGITASHSAGDDVTMTKPMRWGLI